MRRKQDKHKENKMMKQFVLIFALSMFTWMGYAQDIKGKWLTEAGDAQVEIYESNGTVNGKIVWLAKVLTRRTHTTKTRNCAAGN